MTLADKDFTSEGAAERYFADHAFSFDKLSHSEEFGSLLLDVEIAATHSAAGGGFTGGIVFDDIGGAGGGNDPVLARTCSPSPRTTCITR